MGIFNEVLNKHEALDRLSIQFGGDPKIVRIFEKGKRAQIGEIRDWGGGKYQKTQVGWIPVKQSTRTARRDKEGNVFKWGGKLQGPEEYGSPQFEEEINTSYTTEGLYKDDSGEWKAERVEKVHKPIINSYVARGQKNPNEVKTVTLMMGAPATGKGNLRAGLTKRGTIASHVTAIDPDDIKTKALAPDYDRYSERSARKASEFVHEEGSDIAKSTFLAMEQEGFDYLQDKVFSNYKKLIKEINRLDKAGYKVNIVMASCPVKIAYERMIARGKKTGRYVPTKYFNEVHVEIEDTWAKLKENMPSNVLSAQKYDTRTKDLRTLDSFEAK